ncbi:MAG: hypothetical protein H0W87_03365 [Actinobacteria bacterium]|nr:hypothetical protein [Actinomycetota bacterium]
MADRIDGRGGDDRIYGYGGRDQLIGGAGGDVLIGGSSGDLLMGGPGNDRIDAEDRGLTRCTLRSRAVASLGPSTTRAARTWSLPEATMT